jgi:hypothetical protein
MNRRRQSTVFYDIETTDLSPIGQILNYAFVQVDDNWQTVSELVGKIKISNLQLPNPYAIKVQNLDVLEHNKTATDSEMIAAEKISNYLTNISERESSRLVGFNSNKFDLPYIRTTLIRNGINPYFAGNFKYGDVLHCLRRIVADNKDFANIFPKRINQDGTVSDSPVLKLQTVCHSLGLLDKTEEQLHESLYDVKLTIKLAKYLSENYDIDVRNYNSYEVPKNTPTVIKGYPFLDDVVKTDPEAYSYFTVLEQDNRQALWINIKKFEDGLGKESVFWANKNTSMFFVKDVINDKDLIRRAKAAKHGLSDITLENYFPEKNCDIEAFIYSMPLNNIKALSFALWRNDYYLLNLANCKKTSKVCLRTKLANYGNNGENLNDPSFLDSIKKYALYRYGGKMKIDKDDITSEYIEGVYNESFHTTYKELLSMIDDISKDDDSKFIMKQLKKFYDDSILVKVAGSELLNILDRKKL